MLQADNAPLATMSSQLVNRDGCQRHPMLGIARCWTDSAWMQMQQTPLIAIQRPTGFERQHRGEQTQLPDSCHVPLRLGSGVAHPAGALFAHQPKFGAPHISDAAWACTSCRSLPIAGRGGTSRASRKKRCGWSGRETPLQNGRLALRVRP